MSKFWIPQTQFPSKKPDTSLPLHVESDVFLSGKLDILNIQLILCYLLFFLDLLHKQNNTIINRLQKLMYKTDTRISTNLDIEDITREPGKNHEAC